MIVKPETFASDPNAQEAIQLLKIENAALKEEVHENRTKIKYMEFENQQLKAKSAQMDSLYHKIDNM